MLMKPISKLVLPGLAAVVLAMPTSTHACGLFDWLCGRSRVVPVAQTTYAPPFRGPAVVASVPATGFACPVTVCSPPAVGCPTAQTCHYVPETHLQARPRPILTALFGPRVEQHVDPCTGCTVTTTRPRTGLFPQMVPTTTYRMVCSPTFAPAVTYSPVGMYAQPVVGMGVPACPTGCGAPPALPPTQTYLAPGPAPQAVPGPAPYTVPGPATYGAPEAATPESLTPRTFAPPEAQPDLRFEPQPQEPLRPVPNGNTRFNSVPAPLLIDPGHRTTRHLERDEQQPVAVAVRHAVYQPEMAAPAPVKRVEVQWQPASR